MSSMLVVRSTTTLVYRYPIASRRDNEEEVENFDEEPTFDKWDVGIAYYENEDKSGRMYSDAEVEEVMEEEYYSRFPLDDKMTEFDFEADMYCILGWEELSPKQEEYLKSLTNSNIKWYQFYKYENNGTVYYEKFLMVYHDGIFTSYYGRYDRYYKFKETRITKQEYEKNMTFKKFGL